MIAIDRLPERLDLARSTGAVTEDYSHEDLSVLAALKDMTGGMGLMVVSTQLASRRIPAIFKAPTS